jgi:hypothetical protein
MERLLRLPVVTKLWNADDLWGTVAERLAVLPDIEPTRLRPLIQADLQTILGESDSLVAFQVANVAWRKEPTEIGNCVIGRLNRGWIDAVATASKGRPTLPTAASNPAWLSPAVDSVAFAAWVPTQGDRAVDDAQTSLDDLVAAALLLQEDPGSRDLWSLRGDAFRPGVRGLRLHRPALRDVGDPKLNEELSAEIVHVTSKGTRTGHHWFGEEPFPLDDLLDASVRKVVASIMAGRDAIHKRVRTAARWHARFHWSADRADAMLALGVAFDALLAEPGGSPGRVIIERFALLEPSPALRAEAATRIRRIYEARSSVAHGGIAKELSEPDFVREAAVALREASRRILDLSARTDLRTEAAIRDTFDALRWGTMTPPTR